MIRFDHVSFRYQEAWTIRDLEVGVADGELLVVVGPTGSGKSTLLKMINGLVPHFSGGELAGDIVVAGRSVIGASHRARRGRATTTPVASWRRCQISP